MTRAAFLRLLVALIGAGALSKDEGRSLVRAFDAGALDAEVDVPTAPLTGAALADLFRRALATGRRRAASIYARSRGARLPSGDAAAARALRALDALPMRERTALVRLAPTRADDLRGALRREAERRTTVLYADRDAATFGPGAPGSARRSAGSVARWQTAIRQAYAEDAATLARLGAGGELSAVQAQRLATVLAEQAAYVDAFAVRLTQAAAGEAATLSAAQVRSSLVRRSGPARGLFFENAVATGVRSAPVAVEVWYRDRDAPSTCDPCRNAAAGSPYPASGPFPLPGVQCLGGGHCYCELELLPIPA